MRKYISFLMLLLVATGMRAQDFTVVMSADEQVAAGLKKLSPEELARLKAAVERYKSGELAVVEKGAQEKLAAAQAKAKQAEEKAAAAEAKSRDANAPAKVKGPGWLGALTTLARVGENPERAEPLVTRIAGKFEGWSGKTRFALQNGQIWQQNDGGSYFSPPVDSPEVKIVPGRLGGFWMEVEGVNPRVRVKPVKLE